MRLAHPKDTAWDFWDLYDKGKWEPETKAILERFLHPGDTFVDIGAWIGPVSMWAQDLGADVIAYEPDPEAYSLLIANCPDIRAYRAAISDRVGWGHLAMKDYYGDSQSRLGEEGIPVATIDVETLRKQCPHPTLVKLDIEGGECAVLPELMEWRVPVYISWHEPWWPHPVDEVTRSTWFEGYNLEAVRGDGWHGFSEMLAVPR